MSRIDIVIPTYNDDIRLELVLWGLTQQTSGQFNVIIVNDGGAHDTESIVQKYQHILNIKYSYLNPPSAEYRPSKARNHGLKLASCNRVMFLDCDTIPSTGLVSAHMKYAEAGVVTVGPRYYVKEDAIPLLYESMLSQTLTYDHLYDSILKQDDRLTNPSLKRTFNILSCPGFDTITYGANLAFINLCHSCNISYPTDALILLRGFNEDFTGILHGEDHELAIRMIKIGCYIVTLKDDYVFHLNHPPRAVHNRIRQIDIYKQSRLLSLQKRYIYYGAL